MLSRPTKLHQSSVTQAGCKLRLPAWQARVCLARPVTLSPVTPVNSCIVNATDSRRSTYRQAFSYSHTSRQPFSSEVPRAAPPPSKVLDIRSGCARCVETVGRACLQSLRHCCYSITQTLYKERRKSHAMPPGRQELHPWQHDLGPPVSPSGSRGRAGKNTTSGWLKLSARPIQFLFSPCPACPFTEAEVLSHVCRCSLATIVQI